MTTPEMRKAGASPFIVSPEWLEASLGASDLRVVDASWYLPAQKRDAKAEYADGHIPGAVFLDQDEISDPSSGLPHMLPDPQRFAAAASSLGIAETDTIVVYDGPGFFAAPRVWWMFRIMGAANIFVLDGGLDGWKAAGRPLTRETIALIAATFNLSLNAHAVTDFATMRDIVDNGTIQIADARGPGRFTGEEPEPRAGMRSGHMPGAVNVPYSVLASGGRLKSVDELRAVFDEAGLDLSRPVVTTCGSGVTAAVITLALTSLGHEDNSLYDGSWAEWGSRDDTPVEAAKE